jgi:Ca-activated chloride channel family protein
MVVGIDISKSMFATDVYPNRFIFTKQKFDQMLGYLKNTKVSLIGFNANTYLISPLTEDFESLKYLSQNLNVQSLNLGGTDILNTLETANMLFENQKNKVLFLLTDGGDNAQYSKEIAYAKKHNISVYIYNIGTTQGGIVKIKDETLKDKNGNLIVLKLNENIKELALKSGGAYMKQTLYDDDIKLLVEDFLYKFKAKNGKNSTIKDNNELFYIPLLLCVLFFMISIFSLPALSRKDKSQKGIK